MDFKPHAKEKTGRLVFTGDKKTKVMGILNITPDSFSDGNKYLDPEKAAEYALKMESFGADIIDIGGESSRPGAETISAEEELSRILPVIRSLAGKLKVPISVDTYKSEVAAKVLAEGVKYINDITALKGDPELAGIVGDLDAGIILMHMRGTPKTMQVDPEYNDLIEDILDELTRAVTSSEKAGINPDMIIVDPGIGFGKTIEHNLDIIRNLHEFKVMGKPLMVGLSRKSFIGSVTGRSVDERIFGTAAGVAASIMRGADIVRVHDVDQMKDVVNFIDALMRK